MPTYYVKAKNNNWKNAFCFNSTGKTDFLKVKILIGANPLISKTNQILHNQDIISRY